MPTNRAKNSLVVLNKESPVFNVYAKVFSFPKLEVKCVVRNSVGSRVSFLKTATENAIPPPPGRDLMVSFRI